ncbi:MAG: metallophosphoesterase, partial [Treponema sp.]|nr:metallophosphoesterase [Treponema sp.]
CLLMRYAIGDVHGRPFWKNYIQRDYEYFFFTGDYFDSFDIPFSKQFRNFTEICKAARKDSRIKLCLGNHDYHYLRGVKNQQYSGFQDINYEKIGAVLEDNIDLLKILYVTGDNYIISHAGVTAWFFNSIGGTRVEDINGAFEKDRNVLNFNGENIYGDDITQSPIWVRPGSLQSNPLPGYSQIVGHTPVRNITELELDGGNRLVLIDTHDTESIYQF